MNLIKRCFLLSFLLIAVLRVNAQWVAQNLGFSNLNSVKFYGTNEVWIPGFTGLYKSTNNGASFAAPVPLIMSNGQQWIACTLYDVAISSSSVAVGAGSFFLGNDEIIVRTADGGAHWDSTFSYLGTFLAEHRAADFPTSTVCYVAGWQGRVFKSINSGLSWGQVYNNPSITLNSMHFFSANEGVIAGDEGIIRTTNGSSFSQVLTINGSINSVSFRGNVGYAGGSGDSIYKSINNGASWIANSFPYGEIKAVATISVDTVFAATLNMVYKSTDGGLYWNECILPVLNGNFRAMRFRDSNFGYAVGDDGACMKTTNGGGATRPISAFTIPTGPFCQNASVSFTNTSNPAYTFQWLVNGVPMATSFNFTHTFNSGGGQFVSLVAFNGSTYDTLEQNIYINPENFITAPVYQIDTLCYNANGGTVIVTSSVPGWQYVVRNGFTVVSPVQSGNNGTLTFSLPQFTVSPTLNIKVWGTNSCFTDSLVTTFVQPVFPEARTVVYSDTLICAGHENFEATIQNSQPGVWYKMVDGMLGVVDSAAGNNGNITLTAPVFHGMNQTRYINIKAFVNTSCQPNIKNIQLHVDSIYANANVTTPSVNPGQNITFSNTSYADSYLWTFPPQANIPSSTLQNPVITINAPGVYPVTLVAANNEGCTDTIIQNVYVNGVAAAGNTDFCGNGTLLPTNLFAYDSYLDDENNLYVTGTYMENFGGVSYKYFVYKMDSTGAVKWFRSAGNFTHERTIGHGITTDANGNVYVAGQFEGVRVFFGPYDFYAGSATKSKGFLVKLDPDGNEKWLIKMQKADSSGVGCWMSDVVSDNSGNIYVTGGHNNSIFTFPDGSTYTAGGYAGSAYLLKTDSLGTFNGFTTYGATSGGSIAYMPFSFTGWFHHPRINLLSGNRIATATAFKDSTTGGPMSVSFGTNTFSDTSIVCYGAIYNTSTQTWQNAVRGPAGGINYLTDFETDASNNYYFTGFASKYLKAGNLITLDSNNDPANPFYYTHSFVTRINNSGTHAWTNQTRFNQVTDIEITPAGKLLLSLILPANGHVQQLNGVPQTYDTLGFYDYGIGLYDLTGNLESISPKGGSGYDMAFAAKSDACNNIVVVASVNRVGQPVYPLPDLVSAGGSVSVDRYTQDGFCYHNSSCIGAAVDTLSRDAALLDVWMNSDLAAIGSNPISVRLKNFGTTTLTSAQIVISVNGSIQSSFPWGGNLDQYEMMDSVSSGTINLNLAGTNQVKAWVQQPNGSTDLNHANDTVYLAIEACSPLAGTYTIGNGGNFVNFSEAVKRIQTCGLGGHVYFDVLPGIYNDRLLLFNPPSGPNDSIVFRSSTGDSTSVVLQSGWAFPYDNGIVALNNADYITLEKMTIKNLGTEPVMNMVIRCDGDNSHFNLKNCIITRNNPDTTSGDYLLYQGASEDDFATITNNLFYQGANGVLLWGPGQEGTILADNKFINQTEGAILVQDLINPTIINNLIESDFYQQNIYRGISLNLLTQGYNCSGNIMRATNGNAYGIGISTQCGITTPGLISNNMVSITDSKSNSFAFSVGTSTNVKIYNNSFLIDGESQSSVGITVNQNPLTNVEFKNNLITMRDSGYGIWMYNYQAGFITDNNCYYVKKDTLVRVGTSSFNFVYYPSLSDWQTFSGQDAASFVHDPAYLSPADLHIPVDALLDDAALPFPEVPFDVDGQLRNAVTPDMGADEFDCGTLAALNIPPAPYCSTDTIHLSVTAPPAAQVQWYLNGVAGSTQDSISIPYPTPGQLIVTTDVTLASCSQTVSDTLTIVAGTPVSVTAAGPVIFCQGDSVQLNATTGLATYQWYNRYYQIPNATGASFYAKTAGRYRVIGINSNGCAESSTPVVVSVPCIQIDPANEKFSEAIVEWNLNVYPNPVSETIFVETECPYSETTDVVIRDVAGQTIYNEKLAGGTRMLNVRNISPGIYFMEFRCGNELKNQKIVVGH